MSSQQENIKKINEMIKKVEVAMLVSADKDGKLRSRPMTTQKTEFDGNLWFFVSSDADVVDEIKNNPEVNVAYSEDGRFVSVTGAASIVTDDAKKKELWHPELKVWFEGKEPEAPEVMLIKVMAREANYWETGDGMIGNAIRTVKALIVGDSGSPIESGHATFEKAASQATSQVKKAVQAKANQAKEAKQVKETKKTSQTKETKSPKKAAS